MEFKLDGTNSGIVEASQNLWNKLYMEFNDINRWEFSFSNDVDRYGNLVAKTIMLSWHPTNTVYRFLYRKYQECYSANHVKILKIRKCYGNCRWVEDNTDKKWKQKNFGACPTNCDFNDEDKTIVVSATLNNRWLELSRRNLNNRDVLTKQSLKIVLTVPFLAKTLGFPSLRRPSDEWEEEHVFMAQSRRKTKDRPAEYVETIPWGGGPIKFTLSAYCCVSSYDGIYGWSLLTDSWMSCDYKLVHNRCSTKDFKK